MTIYVINMSLNFTATPANIKAGFLATGIFPYNRDTFVHEEILSSHVRRTSTSHKHCSIELQ
jgi:hypothetical protein